MTTTTEGTMDKTTRTDARETLWWQWHDADSARWSSDTAQAEARCAAWVADETNDGPDLEMLRQEAAQAGDDATVRLTHEAE